MIISQGIVAGSFVGLNFLLNPKNTPSGVLWIGLWVVASYLATFVIYPSIIDVVKSDRDIQP